jgi:hypothetical protein
VDTYGVYAASALGAANAFRSLAGFGFPLFAIEIPLVMVSFITCPLTSAIADGMYAKLGDGKLCTRLAWDCITSKALLNVYRLGKFCARFGISYDWHSGSLLLLLLWASIESVRKSKPRDVVASLISYFRRTSDYGVLPKDAAAYMYTYYGSRCASGCANS